MFANAFPIVKNYCILIKIAQKFVPNGSNDGAAQVIMVSPGAPFTNMV